MDSIIDRGILGGNDADAIYDSVTAYVAAVLPQLKSKQLRASSLIGQLCSPRVSRHRVG